MSDVHVLYCIMPIPLMKAKKNMKKTKNIALIDIPTFFEMPQVGETGCLGHASRIEARAIVPLGVHGGPFGEQQLCSRDLAFERRLVQRRRTSGAFSGNPSGPLWASGTTLERPRRRGRTREVVGMLSSASVQRTNEG